MKLSVNVNKIALLRNSRGGNYPDVLDYAKCCIEFGADGITVHPRPDRRHIRPLDVKELSQLINDLKPSYPAVEFNIEGNPFSIQDDDYPGYMALVEQSRPDQATLVPDSSEQLTSDQGFDLISCGARLFPIIKQLQQWNCRVSLFLSPELKQIKEAAKLGADRIELYTGPYAANPDDSLLFNRYKEAIQLALALGLGVNAGHDLNGVNLPKLLTLKGLSEVSIGHALTVDALKYGLQKTIQLYQACLRNIE